MRLRNITGSEEVIADSAFVEQHPKKRRGSWKEAFPKDQPIQIEVGMGKGQFLIEMARLHPDINYIGIERYSSVLIRALQKLEESEPCVRTNLLFLCMNAGEIEEVFAPGEVDKIYLNFSDPWPKKRHAKRRLPSRQYLDKFDKILQPCGRIEFKTDNRQLFDFAVEELEPAGWKAEAVSYDLHADEQLARGNVMTEYEEKFSSLGNPIHKYIIYRERVKGIRAEE